MKYSQFIQETLSSKNGIQWNYYQRSMDIQCVLDGKHAEGFIQDYFNAGAKYLPFLVNPDEAEQFIDRYFKAGCKDFALAFRHDAQHQLPQDRATHTISGFFLGLLIEYCLTGTNTLAIDEPYFFPFSYLWFLTFLYHDYGYCVSERDEFPNPFPSHAPLPALFDNRPSPITPREYSALSSIKRTLGINLSPFSQYRGLSDVGQHGIHHPHYSVRNLLCKLTDRSNRISGSPKLKFNNDTIIHGHRYLSSTITRYMNYCINIREKVDHGIIGGLLFYDRMLKNYALSYIAHAHACVDEPDIKDFHYRDRHFCFEQLKAFAYIADCILSHNIWKQGPNMRTVYEHYALTQLLEENFRPISFENNPLLYILVVADTLEPLKAYTQHNCDLSIEEIIDAIEVEYLPASRSLTLSSNSSNVDIAVLHGKAMELQDWTAVECSPLTDNSFQLRL